MPYRVSPSQIEVPPTFSEAELEDLYIKEFPLPDIDVVRSRIELDLNAISLSLVPVIKAALNRFDIAYLMEIEEDVKEFRRKLEQVSVTSLSDKVEPNFEDRAKKFIKRENLHKNDLFWKYFFEHRQSILPLSEHYPEILYMVPETIIPVQIADDFYNFLSKNRFFDTHTSKKDIANEYSLENGWKEFILCRDNKSNYYAIMLELDDKNRVLRLRAISILPSQTQNIPTGGFRWKFWKK